jgi:hypothetical protein
MNYAIINSGIVENIIEWDGTSEYNAEGVLVETDANAYVGGVYADGAFVPRPPEPERDTRTYAEKRRYAYPSWQEQLDMMYHDQTEGSRTWLDAIEAVKEAYPK